MKPLRFVLRNFAMLALVALFAWSIWPKSISRPASGSGTAVLYFGVPTTIGTSGATPVTLAAGKTGSFAIQAVNQGSVDALISFDGEQTTPTYLLKVPANTSNTTPFRVVLNNSTILLSRGNAASDVTGFSMIGY